MQSHVRPALLLRQVDAEATFLNSLDMRIEALTGVAIEICGDLFKVRSCDCACRRPAAAPAAPPSPAIGISRRDARLIRAIAALQREIAFGDEHFFRRRTIAQSFALLVERQERRLADALPFGGAFARPLSPSQSYSCCEAILFSTICRALLKMKT